MSILNKLGLNLLGTMALCIGLVLSVSQIAQAQSAPFGTYNNAPRVGKKIVPYAGSVICKVRDDAVEMAKTGFFTDSCETLEKGRDLVVDTRVLILVGPGEEFVWMLSTIVDGETLWVPIPWHDWNS